MTRKAVSRRAFRRLVARFGRGEGERGGATVEFVIILPIFLLVFVSSFEMSIFLTRQVMLERAIDLAVREIRLDRTTVTRRSLRRAICDRARILPDCDLNLVVEMTIIDEATYAVAGSSAPCVNREESIVPETDFPGHRTGKMVFLRACYVVEPAIPITIAGIQSLGTHMVERRATNDIQMVSSSLFVVESD
ncbi:Flp pilus assembly protein TadG [Jannaschia seosinensis]|uniref:Flp pilus assembly protein TadG n=1 Tax=Jannaschia seosinensis TaxID=313367 RepID=A0A0M7BDE0_9RHOB|nr:TadE family protein [Jannaschia seosinensis]CUH40750.1 Flp pilus assembly protein TadG [Jannaschia seosinensis]